MKGDLPFLVLAAGSSAFGDVVRALHRGAVPIIPPSVGCLLQCGVGIVCVELPEQKREVLPGGKRVVLQSVLNNFYSIICEQERALWYWVRRRCGCHVRNALLSIPGACGL